MSDYKDLEWYFADGTCIEGDAAYNYLSRKLEKFKDISNVIDHVLLECLKLNVINEDDSIDNVVCGADENLSMIQIELELLLKKLNKIIG